MNNDIKIIGSPVGVKASDQMAFLENELQRLKDHIATLQKRQLPEGWHLAKTDSGHPVFVKKNERGYMAYDWGNVQWDFCGHYVWSNRPGPFVDLIEIDGEEAGADQ